MGTVQEPLAEGTKGAPHLGPERPRVYSDLSPEEKDRYNADIRATNVLLQGLPKDIYTLINHYTDAKDKWDNVKMLLEGSELTKEDRESQPTSSNTKNQATVQDGRVVVQNVQVQQNRGQGINPRGRGAVGHIARNCTQPKHPQNSDYYKDKMLLMQAQENEVALDAEQLLFLAGGQDNAIDDDVDEKPVQDLALNLKYQNLKDCLGNNPPTPDKDTPDFDSVFVNETRSDTDRTLKVRTVDSQITQLTEKVTVLQAQNDVFRAENDKIKQHYKELYDSIKITRTKHIEQVTTLTTENVNLKAQILDTINSVSKDHVKPKVLAPGKYVIDVEPIVPRLRNNREAHLDYLRHLKESVETIRDIVEEAKVVRPLDSLIFSAFRYTKHSQELLEYAIGTCP
nr:retrovirus-related Pol polyprotein from transposon TNT 1-94 [Tanacetum cinerariifolium]